jgi:hypothetical protein
MKKILLNRDFIPNNTFDWSLLPEDRVNRNGRRLLSISSCGIPEEQLPWPENLVPKDRQNNIKNIKDEYAIESKPNEYLMKLAGNSMKGNGQSYYKYSKNHI